MSNIAKTCHKVSCTFGADSKGDDNSLQDKDQDPALQERRASIIAFFDRLQEGDTIVFHDEHEGQFGVMTRLEDIDLDIDGLGVGE